MSSNSVQYKTVNSDNMASKLWALLTSSKKFLVLRQIMCHGIALRLAKNYEALTIEETPQKTKDKAEEILGRKKEFIPLKRERAKNSKQKIETT